MSIGYRPDGKTWRRQKVSGRTRAEVAAKLRELHAEHDAGAQPVPGYTVHQMVSDWLAEGLDGRSGETVKLNRNVLKPVVAYIGDIELRKLTAHDVRRALTRLAATHSSRTVVVVHNALTRAIRHAEANRHVLHNVAALVDTPTGQKGRPSQALTAEQAVELLAAAQDARLGAYVVLCLLTGIRTEEARALRWDHVDLEGALLPCGVRYGAAATPRLRDPVVPCGYPGPPSRHCGNIKPDKQVRGWPPGSCGRIRGWCSPPHSEPCSEPATSGGSSRPFARRPGSDLRGRRESSGPAM